MILNQIWNKFKPSGNVETISFDEEGREVKSSYFKPFFLSLVIILVASFSFGLGRLSSMTSREPIKIEYDQDLLTYTTEAIPTSQQTATVLNSVGSTDNPNQVYASSNGKKYYYAHCSGLKRILQQNKISFSSEKAAEAAGYTLAANCSPR